jgi:hypothetical protein
MEDRHLWAQTAPTQEQVEKLTALCEELGIPVPELPNRVRAQDFIRALQARKSRLIAEEKAAGKGRTFVRAAPSPSSPVHRLSRQ